MGTVEITPIYGVKGNKAHDVSYLSPQWMALYGVTVSEAKKEGMLVDMNNGTGWPFGGLGTSTSDAACKLVVSECHVEGGKRVEWPVEVADTKQSSHARLERLMAFSTGGKCLDLTSKVSRGKLVWDAPAGEWHLVAAFCGKTLQKVKRAAPGGEGYVIDHFSARAVKDYLLHFDKAFATSGVAFPHNFFNDSYEVYKADWTEGLFDEFYARRGYKLEEHLPEFLSDVRTDTVARIVSDYRETLSDLLLENFTRQWTAWAHAHGTQTRSQAHGSPGNLIDLYAAVDVPECEGFGLTDFGIKGLRKDSLTRPNFSDISMLKYASSAAHIAGKPYTSSETFTWLTEHFRTSLSQCKPDLDLMFLSGVNHVYFHGTTYSPKDDPWPGWKFYASIDMSPTNSIWRDAPWLLKYIERCQSFLQMGRPDNDFMVLLPVRDMWAERTGKGEKSLLMQFDIHSMAKKAPEFIKSILAIDKAGFDCDYISEKYLMGTTYKDGKLETAAGTRYSALIIPGSGKMPASVKAHVDSLKNAGAKVIYGVNVAEMSQAAAPELMKSKYGLRAIRRSNATGHHYFIANLSPNDVDAVIPLTVTAADARWFNPLTGDIYAAELSGEGVHVCLRSGESMILQTYNRKLADAGKPMPRRQGDAKRLDGKWTLSFVASAPAVSKTFALDSLHTWETLDDDSVKVTMGTGAYTTHVSMTAEEARSQWSIDLGDVRESARVYVNDSLVGCAWSVPFILQCGNVFKAGDNTVRIEVTNLPANRIADLDRKGVQWRKFKDINVANLNYKKGTYSGWEPVKSGLNSSVTLYKMK